MNGLVGAEDLAGAKTRIPPKFRDLVKSGKDAGGDALSVRVSRPQQQQISRRLDMFDERANAIDPVGGNEPLLGKNIF